jgi:hypothetical protein
LYRAVAGSVAASVEVATPAVAALLCTTCVAVFATCVAAAFVAAAHVVAASARELHIIV